MSFLSFLLFLQFDLSFISCFAMSSISPVPTVVGKYASEAPQCYAAAITTYVMAAVAVALRLWARRLMKAEIWVDDWTAVVALLLATGFFTVVIVWLHQGFGHHFEILPKDYLTTFGKNFFTGEILYFLTIGVVKCSILAFYWRLFRASIRVPCCILGAVTICWEIAVLLITVLQCTPISGFWNKGIHAKCLNTKYFFLGNSVPNIVTDLALLLLPVPYIWRLHATTSQKIVLAGTFMLGGFVTVISIVRLTIIVKLDTISLDVDYNSASLVSWSLAESNMAIVAACLPSLRPILSLIISGEPDPPVRGSRGKAYGRSWTRGQPSAIFQPLGQPTSPSDSQRNFMSLSDAAYGFSGIQQLHGIAGTDSRGRKINDQEDIEMQTASRRARDGIEVRTDVTVQSTKSNEG